MDRRGETVPRKSAVSRMFSHGSKQPLESLGTGERYDEHSSEEVGPTLPARPGLSLKTSISKDLEDGPSFQNLEMSDTQASATSVATPSDYALPSTNSLPTSLSATSTRSAESTSSQGSKQSNMQKAFEEARHFAGGLISRPTESTKHFTILRHSHGLVFYQGTDTSLAISIFSDEPLPVDRTLWLQSKGWSGKTGMRAKALMGMNGKWLNVTPTLAIGSEQLNPTDERAWQRDFKKFQKKGPSKIRDRHLLRETAIVRIPSEAGDGYFQIVLCTGEKKKPLCCSPPFRVLSTSTRPSSIKGASLSTLPLEMGAKVLGTYALGTVGAAASVATAPFQIQVQQYMPSFWTRKAASAAYSVTGAEAKVDSALYDDSLTVAERVEIALEEGPKAPYPINFVASCEGGDVSHVEEFNIPQLRLSLPESDSNRLHGHYFGWARALQKLKGKSASDTTWSQATVSATLADISKLARVDIKQANKKTFTLRFIDSSDKIPSDLAKLEIRIMGFIRPDEPVQQAKLEEGLDAGNEAAVEASMITEFDDVSMAQQFLDHPSWAPHAKDRELAQAGKAARLDKMKKGYAETRLAAQRQIDKVPLNKYGVRAPGDSTKSKAVVMNGFYVVR